MAGWTFLTNHGRALLCIASDPGVRLRDIAERLGVTERSAYGIVTDMTTAGYVKKGRDGRRNRYEIQAHLPINEALGRELSISEVLDFFLDGKANDGVKKPRTPAAPALSKDKTS